MNRVVLAAVIAGLAGVTAVAAQDDGRHGKRMGREAAIMQQWDTNGDGTVTRDEAQAAAAEQTAKRFDALDQNKDGVITADELKQLREARRAAMQERFQEHFKAADTNGDGVLDESEASKGMPMLARRFAEIDTNKDGTISQDELKAHHPHRKPMRRPAQ
ncbi:MAG TPA: EF-hand domain-containing protein [Steroidobacteraceae bacterium]